jgi:hypothetical protein
VGDYIKYDLKRDLSMFFILGFRVPRTVALTDHWIGCTASASLSGTRRPTRRCICRRFCSARWTIPRASARAFSSSRRRSTRRGQESHFTRAHLPRQGGSAGAPANLIVDCNFFFCRCRLFFYFFLFKKSFALPSLTLWYACKLLSCQDRPDRRHVGDICGLRGA